MKPRLHEEDGVSFAFLGLSHFEQLEQKARQEKVARVEADIKRLKEWGAKAESLDVAFRARGGYEVSDQDILAYLRTSDAVRWVLDKSLEIAGQPDATRAEIIDSYGPTDARNLAMKLLGLGFRMKIWPDGKGVDDPLPPEPLAGTQEESSETATSTPESSGE